MVSDAVVDGIAGASGSILALLATYPLKTIYTLQALDSKPNAAPPGILEIILRYKLGGLYTGIEPNIFESGVSSGVYFFLYNKLRALAVRQKQEASGEASAAQPAASSKDKDIGFLASLLVPAVAAVGNQLCTMPASVVATRMQASKKAYIEGKTRESPTVMSVIRSVWDEGGLGGFWAGLVPSLVLISNPSIQFMIYEQLLRLLRAWKRRRLAAQHAARKVELSAAQQREQAILAAAWQEAVQDGAAANTRESSSTDTNTSSAVRVSQPNGGSHPGTPELLTLEDGSPAGSGTPSGGGADTHTDTAVTSGGPGHTPIYNALEASLAPASAGAAGAIGHGASSRGPSEGGEGEVVIVRLAPWETFLASALAKIGATLSTYWLVVVKSRMQAASKSTPDKQYTSTWNALVRIWSDEGLGGFHKGLGAKLIQTALNAALMLMLKEQIYTFTRQLLTGTNIRKVQHLVN